MPSVFPSGLAAGRKLTRGHGSPLRRAAEPGRASARTANAEAVAPRLPVGLPCCFACARFRVLRSSVSRVLPRRPRRARSRTCRPRFLRQRVSLPRCFPHRLPPHPPALPPTVPSAPTLSCRARHCTRSPAVCLPALPSACLPSWLRLNSSGRRGARTRRLLPLLLLLFAASVHACTHAHTTHAHTYARTLTLPAPSSPRLLLSFSLFHFLTHSPFSLSPFSLSVLFPSLPPSLSLSPFSLLSLSFPSPFSPCPSLSLSPSLSLHSVLAEKCAGARGYVC